MQAAKFGITVHFEDIEPVRYIRDSEEIHFGRSILKAFLTPGHSPASLVFYCEADGCLFAGDVIFRDSIGRTDLWGGDFNTLTASIRNRIFTLPDDTAIYPGHGPATTVAHEKSHNPYL